MKSLLLLSICSLFCIQALTAEEIAVSAKVLDRDAQGAAIPGKYVYPSVTLESGETGTLHIGEDFRYAAGDAAEAPFAERKIGLILSLRVVAEEDSILYSAEASSVILDGNSESGSNFSASTATFFGKAASGEMIEVRMRSADGRGIEDLAIHFEQE